VQFGNATLQIGDGDHLAVGTGIITISDFRQKHIAAGGEGAPLAIYGDHLLFSKKGENRFLLNIGGIANFTFLPESGKKEEIVSSDTGPGNTLMDAFIRKHIPGTAFDQDGKLAASGSPDQALLNALLDHPFFGLPFPKTTGPELFNPEYLESAVQKSDGSRLTIADIMATLNRFTAESIALAIREHVSGKNNVTIYISGGGLHNPILIETLRNLLPGYTLASIAELGIHPDAKESVLFAALANESICGEEMYGNDRVKGMPDVALGKISFPG
jgi:anhydro-N-acetylmuramic acid kinase